MRRDIVSREGSSMQSPPPTILCVDDEPNALAIRKMLFEHAGYTVFSAPDAATALKLFNSYEFDVVLSDHLLPGESGAELARQMKVLKPHIPIALLSGVSDLSSGVELADAFINKAEGPAQLLERIAALLKSSAEAQDEEMGRRSLHRHICHFRQRDHVCFAYANKAEQMQAVVPWIQQGLRRGEKCRYIADHNSASDIQHELGRAGINVQHESERGALVFATKRETYLLGERFEPQEMLSLLQQDVDDCAKSGFSGFRVAGEMTWSLGSEPGCNRLVEYESGLDNFFDKNRALGLCQYSLARFSPSRVADVARVHHVGVSKATNGSGRWNLRIRRDHFFADLFEDRDREQFQYCVQRDGSREIVELGGEHTLRETRKSAEACLRLLCRASTRLN
jgi:CheY-like chemotaxis protein